MQQKKSFLKKDCSILLETILVRVTGLEPARDYHQNLNLACLPIPPHPRDKSYYIVIIAFMQVLIIEQTLFQHGLGGKHCAKAAAVVI